MLWIHHYFLDLWTVKRQKRRLETDEDDAHLDWGKDKVMIFGIRKVDLLQVASHKFLKVSEVSFNAWGRGLSAEAEGWGR